MATKKTSKTNGAKTPKTRVPAHGRGRLQVGNFGNAGGDRPPNAIRALLRECAWAAAEELLKRLRNPKTLRQLSVGELRAILDSAGRLAVPLHIKSDGAPFPVAVIGPYTQLRPPPAQHDDGEPGA
ncbi:MAG: hypothetical protein ACREM1_12970 [Longimicrobiales bacterium]